VLPDVGEVPLQAPKPPQVMQKPSPPLDNRNLGGNSSLLFFRDPLSVAAAQSRAEDHQPRFATMNREYPFLGPDGCSTMSLCTCDVLCHASQ
jgi:hypothetical protein